MRPDDPERKGAREKFLCAGRSVSEGTHVTGTTSAFGFLQAMQQFATAEVSASFRQDVLLLAVSEDHYVPLEQWHYQMRMRKNPRSVTARLFTRSESAQNHCVVGKYGPALRTIVKWLEPMLVENAVRVHETSQAAGKKEAEVVQIKSNTRDIDIKSAPIQSGPPAGARVCSGLSA